MYARPALRVSENGILKNDIIENDLSKIDPYLNFKFDWHPDEDELSKGDAFDSEQQLLTFGQLHLELFRILKTFKQELKTLIWLFR